MQIDTDGAISPHHPECFGCGPDNPAGIGLRMRVDGDLVRAELTFDARHQGAPGLAHGGAIAAALDDLFGGVLVMLAAPAVTANLNVDFRAPVPLEEPLALSACCDRADGRKLRMSATVELGGAVLTEATALFLRVDIAHFEAASTAIPESWRGWSGFTDQLPHQDTTGPPSR